MAWFWLSSLLAVASTEAKAQNLHSPVSIEVVQEDTANELSVTFMARQNPDGSYEWTFDTTSNGFNLYYRNSDGTSSVVGRIINNQTDQALNPHPVSTGDSDNNLINEFDILTNTNGETIGYKLRISDHIFNTVGQASGMRWLMGASRIMINGLPQWVLTIARGCPFFNTHNGRVNIMNINAWWIEIGSPEITNQNRYDNLDTVTTTVDEATNITTISGTIQKFSADTTKKPLSVAYQDSLEVTTSNGEILYVPATYTLSESTTSPGGWQYDVNATVNTCDPIVSIRTKSNYAGTVDQYSYQGTGDAVIASQQDPEQIPSDLGAQLAIGAINAGSAETVTIALTAQLSPEFLSLCTLVLSDGSNEYTGVYDGSNNVFVFTAVPLGTYACTLQWSDCSATNTVIVDNTTGLPGTTQATLALYPNPAQSQLTVPGAVFSHYIISGITGQVIDQGSLRGNTIDIGGLAPGAYIIGLFNAAGDRVKAQFIKQ